MNHTVPLLGPRHQRFERRNLAIVQTEFPWRALDVLNHAGQVLVNGRHGAPNVDLVRSFYKHSSIGGGMDLVPDYQLTKSIPRS